MHVVGSGELLLPGHQSADELEALVPCRLEKPPDMTADRADALALCREQGLEFLFPEGAPSCAPMFISMRSDSLVGGNKITRLSACNTQ